jgi:hypothetical protein
MKTAPGLNRLAEAHIVFVSLQYPNGPDFLYGKLDSRCMTSIALER